MNRKDSNEMFKIANEMFESEHYVSAFYKMYEAFNTLKGERCYCTEYVKCLESELKKN